MRGSEGVGNLVGRAYELGVQGVGGLWEGVEFGMVGFAVV